MFHFCPLVSNAEIWRTRCTCDKQRIEGHKCESRYCPWPANRKDHRRERGNDALMLPSVAQNSLMQLSQCALWYSKDITVPLTTYLQFPACNYPLQFLACLMAQPAHAIHTFQQGLSCEAWTSEMTPDTVRATIIFLCLILCMSVHIKLRPGGENFHYTWRLKYFIKEFVLIYVRKHSPTYYRKT
jgi:hypothetical protein